MRHPAYTWLLLALAVAPDTGLASDIRRKVSAILSEDPPKVTPSAVADEDRDAVFAELRAAVHPDPAAWYDDAALIRLMNLGDTNIVPRVVQNHFRHKWGVGLRMELCWKDCNHPYAIECVAEYLDSSERFDKYAGTRAIGDTDGLPRSTEAARIICRILRNSDVFPTAVKAWAEALTQGNWIEGKNWIEAANGQRWEELREAVRQWWRENKAHMVAGEYSQVKPPEQQKGCGK